MTSESAITSGPKHPDESPSACTTRLRKGKATSDSGGEQARLSVKRLVDRGSVGSRETGQGDRGMYQDKTKESVGSDPACSLITGISAPLPAEPSSMERTQVSRQ